MDRRTTQPDTIRKHQQDDPVCSQISQFCRSEWPSKKKLASILIPFWKERHLFSIYDNILLYNDRIVIPEALQEAILEKIHEGHQGVEKCHARLRATVWWPHASKQVTTMIEQCPECAKSAKKRREPLINTPLPLYPWQSVGTDLFELQGKSYVIVVDYFSRYPEVLELRSTTLAAVVSALQLIFSRHGIPKTLRNDNEPQYSSAEFTRFASTYGFRHDTSSPHFPESNGQAERAVQTVKNLLKQSKDPYLALLSY